MADLSAGAQKLLAYWGNIQSAVASRASTAELWSTVQAAAAADNYSIAGATAIDMGQLRALAAGNRNAMEAFGRAGQDATITDTMLGSELYARFSTAANPEPQYFVRFEHLITENGQQTTVWRTDVFRGLLPPTKGQLLEQLNADAQGLADEYNQAHIGIGSVSIGMG